MIAGERAAELLPSVASATISAGVEEILDFLHRHRAIAILIDRIEYPAMEIIDLVKCERTITIRIDDRKQNLHPSRVKSRAHSAAPLEPAGSCHPLIAAHLPPLLSLAVLRLPGAPHLVRRHLAASPSPAVSHHLLHHLAHHLAHGFAVGRRPVIPRQTGSRTTVRPWATWAVRLG